MSYKLYKVGKFNVIEQPESYFQMVKELYLHHEDLLMFLAMLQGKLEDGTAIYILITHLNLELRFYNGIPIEEGYQIIYEALKERTGKRYTEDQLHKAVNDYRANETDQDLAKRLGYNQDEEHAKQGIFEDKDTRH